MHSSGHAQDRRILFVPVRPDNNLHILPQRDQETQKPFYRELTEFPPQYLGNIGLADAEQIGRVEFAQALAEGNLVSVEPFHLFCHVDEQAFRYNYRKHEDGEAVSDYERFKRPLNQVVAKRLTYKELTGKEGETADVF